MAYLQKKNSQEKQKAETVSNLDNKRQYLLDELAQLMDETNGNYGPFLMKELQRRLEVVVQNFNDELKVLIKSSFENWKIKDSQIRDLMVGKLQDQQRQPKKVKPKDPSTITVKQTDLQRSLLKAWDRYARTKRLNTTKVKKQP